MARPFRGEVKSWLSTLPLFKARLQTSPFSGARVSQRTRIIRNCRLVRVRDYVPGPDDVSLEEAERVAVEALAASVAAAADGLRGGPAAPGGRSQADNPMAPRPR